MKAFCRIQNVSHKLVRLIAFSSFFLYINTFFNGTIQLIIHKQLLKKKSLKYRQVRSGTDGSLSMNILLILPFDPLRREGR